MLSMNLRDIDSCKRHDQMHCPSPLVGWREGYPPMYNVISASISQTINNAMIVLLIVFANWRKVMAILRILWCTGAQMSNADYLIQCSKFGNDDLNYIFNKSLINLFPFNDFLLLLFTNWSPFWHCSPLYRLFFTSFIFPYFAYFGEALSSLNKGKGGN